MLVAVDEATRVCVVQDMKGKDDTITALRTIIARFAAVKIVVGEGSTLHTDSEAVLTSKQMTEFLASQRIVSRASPPHTHERNGIAERAIRTVFDTARALLRQAELHKKFWPIALQHAVFLRNQAPTSALGGRTPAQVLAGDARVKLPRLYKFGCKVFVKVDESGRRALDDKARVGIYVGHNTLSNSHRVLLRNSTRWDVVDTIHCTIDESALASNTIDAKAVAEADQLPVLATPPVADAPAAPAPVPAPAAAQQPAAKPPVDESRDPLLDDFDGDEDAYVTAVTAGPKVPGSYRAAMQSAKAKQWSVAIKSELDSLVENGTFEVVPEREQAARLALGAHREAQRRWQRA